MPRRIDKLREAGTNELEAQQKELSEQIFRLKFQLSTGQSEALKRLRDAKKDLARVKTLLRAHELKINTGTPNGRAMTMPYLLSRRVSGGGGSPEG